MKEIKLTKGQITLVDDKDFKFLSKLKWSCSPQNYAVHNEGDNRGKKKRIVILMHRLILDVPKGMVVDHIDMNGLNNQRSNLRLATRSQNAANSISRTGVSKYKGVTWDKRRKRWRARINQDGIEYTLGYFPLERLAGKAYDVAAKELFGKFAYLNFP